MYNFELLLPPNFPFKAWKLGATASPRSVMWLASLTTFTKTCNGEKRKGKNQMHIQASYIACVCVCQTASTQKIFQIFKVNSHQKYDDVEKSIVSLHNWNVWVFFRLFIRVGGGSSLKNFDCFLFWFLDEVDDWAIDLSQSSSWPPNNKSL